MKSLNEKLIERIAGAISIAEEIEHLSGGSEIEAILEQLENAKTFADKLDPIEMEAQS